MNILSKIKTLFTKQTVPVMRVEIPHVWKKGPQISVKGKGTLVKHIPSDGGRYEFVSEICEIKGDTLQSMNTGEIKIDTPCFSFYYRKKPKGKWICEMTAYHSIILSDGTEAHALSLLSEGLERRKQ